MKDNVYLPLVIGTNDSGSLTWNIDALFAVHLDCKSHTGACLTWEFVIFTIKTKDQYKEFN